ncbi:hypothetical protein ACF1BU_19885 [Streptomyces sp. NPDC014724]|uniref:hypothetical protein n=1 Tax=unclassified Streptomyces TaxID=2593676 RepID=UPI0036FE2F4B
MTDRNPPGRACLHELAAQRRLPAHQPMDQMTLGWISDHRPANFDAAPSFPRPGLMLVPARSWFLSERQSEANHGVRHNARVSLYAALPDLTTILPTLHGLAKQLCEGAHVVTHCRAGIGRSSLLAAALLILNGVDPETSWHQIERARGLAVPDTAEQREWTMELLQ